MSTKKEYSIIPIYAAALVWILWSILFRFPKPISFILCAVVSIVVFVLLIRVFPPRSVAENLDENAKAAISAWESLVKISKKHARDFAGKGVAPSLQSLSDNIGQICKAVRTDPARAKNSYIRRFESIYLEYCKDLSEYETCSKIADPGQNVQKILRLTEDRFAALAKISKTLVDEVYSGNILSLQVENDVLKQLFATLQSKSDFALDAADDKIELVLGQEGSN